MELREEPLRVELRPVLGAVEVPEESVAGPDAVAIAAERVHLARARGIEGEPEVRERHRVLLQPVAPVVIRLGERVALLDEPPGQRVDHIPHAIPVHQEDVGPGAIGGIAVQVLAEQGERSATHAEPESTIDVRGGPVVGIVLGRVATGLHVQERRERPFLHHHVHDAGDSVRAVLGRRAVPQHLDPVDGAAGQGVEVHAGGARPHAVGERVHHRHLMAPPPVHQHQRVVGGEAAQRERPNDIIRVGHALARKVHRRRQRLEDLARLARALLRQLLGREHVHRHRQLFGRGVTRARPDYDVDRRERDRLRGHREVLRGRATIGDGHARRLGDVAEQPHAHGEGARAHAANIVLTLLVARRAQPRSFDGDLRAGQRSARGIGDAAVDRPGLRGERGRSEDEQRGRE